MKITIKSKSTGKRLATYLVEKSKIDAKLKNKNLGQSQYMNEAVKYTIELAKRRYPILIVGRDYSVNVKNMFV